MLYKVVLTFKAANQTLMWDHSKESYWAVLSCDIVPYWTGCIFLWNLRVKALCVTIQITALLNELVFCLSRFVNYFSNLWALLCNHSNESYWAIFLYRTVYHAACTRPLQLLCLSPRLHIKWMHDNWDKNSWRVLFCDVLTFASEYFTYNWNEVAQVQ